MLEIITPEWKYISSKDTSNYAYVVQVKEQRRLGTVRGNTKTIPQAPSIKVRIKADTPGLPDKACVKADLWTYGTAFKGRNRHEFIPPMPESMGHKLTHLRNDIHIACVDNVAPFSEECPDGYRYAELSCFITRGARVCSRRNHIAFRLSVVVQKPGAEVKNVWENLCLTTNKGKWLSKTQISKLIQPDFGEENIAYTVTNIPAIRTARMSISEKAMCPRECDQKKRKGTSKRKCEEVETSDFDDSSSTKSFRTDQSDLTEIPTLSTQAVSGVSGVEHGVNLQQKLVEMFNMTNNLLPSPSSLQLLSLPGFAGLQNTYPIKPVEASPTIPMLPFYGSFLGVGNGLNGLNIPISDVLMRQLAQTLSS